MQLLDTPSWSFLRGGVLQAWWHCKAPVSGQESQRTLSSPLRPSLEQSQVGASKPQTPPSLAPGSRRSKLTGGQQMQLARQLRLHFPQALLVQVQRWQKPRSKMVKLN